MIDAVNRTAVVPATTIVVGLDKDDAHHYDRRPGVRYVVAERMGLAAWTNVLAEQCWDEFDILASWGDDHVARTRGWDAQVELTFAAHGPGLVYCADGLQNERLPTAPFWSSSIIKALGFYCPPGYQHMYVDNYWLVLARRLERCRYLPDVLIEHRHPSAGKADWDESYLATNAPAAVEADRRANAAYLRDHLSRDVDRVLAALPA
jgi:hypothetical protein